MRIRLSTLQYWSFKISKNYSCDINLFYRYRDVKDGISFIDGTISWDRYIDDHCPKFEMRFGILNFWLLDFSIYNVNHKREPSCL
jgi:hypothetical protein